jgi:uncharacterized membrane protein
MSGKTEDKDVFTGKMTRFLSTDDGQRITVCAFSIVAALVLFLLPGGSLAYLFGVPFMFFVPGFVVVRMFFWEKTSLETKFVLSLGLSVLVIIILGLILVFTPIGLNSDSTRASLIVFSVGGVAVEWLMPKPKAKKLPEEEPPVSRETPLKLDKVAVAMLATALVVSGISLGLVVTADYPSRTYFAITDDQGMTITNWTYTVGTNLTVRMEMQNGEDGPRTFICQAYAYGTDFWGTQTASKLLEKGEKWTHDVYFILAVTGHQRFDFDLYIQDGSEPPVFYANLHIWIHLVSV